MHDGKAKSVGKDSSPAEGSGAAEAAARDGVTLVVGMGASAGGLEAFRAFFSNMPVDTGMAFILVQHLDPDHASALVDILRGSTAMAVSQARTGDAIAQAFNDLRSLDSKAVRDQRRQKFLDIGRRLG